MTTINEFLNPFAVSLIEALINSLWQGVVIMCLVWCVLRLIRLNATTRYAILYATLLAIFCLPFLTALGAGPTTLATHETSSPALYNAGDTLPAQSAAKVVTSSGQSRAVMLDESLEPGIARAPATEGSSTTQTPGFRIELFSGHWALLLAGIYLVVASWMTARVIRSCCYLQRLKREAVPLRGKYQSYLGGWLKAYGIKRPVSLGSSREITMPMAAGSRNAMILIPEKLLDELTEPELKQILLHELAHIGRYDDWTNCVQKIVEAVLFFHPAVPWIRPRLNLEREVASDDWVISLTGERRPYASCLIRLIELVIRPRSALVAPGAAMVRKHVFKRIELLLDKERNAMPRLSKFSCTLILGLLFAALLQCSQLSPVFAFTGERTERLRLGDAQKMPFTLLPELKESSAEMLQTAPLLSAMVGVTEGWTLAGHQRPAEGTRSTQAGQATSAPDIERQVQELMEPKLREMEQQMLAVMQPKIHEVERQVHQMMEPKLQEISKLEGEAVRAQMRELQKETDRVMGSKLRELESLARQSMEPKVRELETEIRETLKQRGRGIKQ